MRDLRWVDLRDVGVIQRGQDLSFALEARHALGVAGEGIGQYFQRDFSLQLGVAGPIHQVYPRNAVAI